MISRGNCKVSARSHHLCLVFRDAFSFFSTLGYEWRSAEHKFHRASPTLVGGLLGSGFKVELRTEPCSSLWVFSQDGFHTGLAVTAHRKPKLAGPLETTPSASSLYRGGHRGSERGQDLQRPHSEGGSCRDGARFQGATFAVACFPGSQPGRSCMHGGGLG